VAIRFGDKMLGAVLIDLQVETGTPGTPLAACSGSTALISISTL
jgi:hypothetical protein